MPDEAPKKEQTSKKEEKAEDLSVKRRVIEHLELMMGADTDKKRCMQLEGVVLVASSFIDNKDQRDGMIRDFYGGTDGLDMDSLSVDDRLNRHLDHYGEGILPEMIDNADARTDKPKQAEIFVKALRQLVDSKLLKWEEPNEEEAALARITKAIEAMAPEPEKKPEEKK